MWQLAILGDYETLQTKISKLATNGRKEDREPAITGQNFFSLLIRGDKLGLENLIQQHALIKKEGYVIDDCMSYFGFLETKLCWFKGIPIEIASPLVPMGLMPVKPLDHYDDIYDFLQPDWVPLRENWFARIKLRFAH